MHAKPLTSLRPTCLGGLGRSHRGEVACQEIGLCIAPTSAELWRRPRSLKYKAWGVDHSELWEEVDDFPETVDMKEPCKLGECLCALTPRQADRYETITQEFKLALRHSGHPALSPLLFELRCGLEVRYCLIGDNDWTHTLRCDFL